MTTADIWAGVRALDDSLARARDLLGGGDEAAPRAERLLAAAEDSLAELTAQPGLGEGAATRLREVWDRLGGHLLAVTVLAAIEVSPQVVAGLLRQAVAEAQAGIDGLLEDEPVAAR
jgi:hypothetical protein